MRLTILSAGAAQALVTELAEALRTPGGIEIEATFGAVGAMKEKLLEGSPCDVIILTQAQIAELSQQGRVLADSVADLGQVRTGVAVREGDAYPAVDTPAALRDALIAAGAIYFPDPLKATAGIHFMKVLEGLGIHAALEARLRPHANGAAAMRALAASTESRPIGCSQITEILYIPGVALIAPLPKQFELATIYSAAVCSDAPAPEAARRFVQQLSGDASRKLRLRAGFEFTPAAGQS